MRLEASDDTKVKHASQFDPNAIDRTAKVWPFDRFPINVLFRARRGYAAAMGVALDNVSFKAIAETGVSFFDWAKQLRDDIEMDLE